MQRWQRLGSLGRLFSTLFVLGGIIGGGVFGATSADAYQLLGAEWDPQRGPVQYAFHPEGSDDISDGSEFEAVRAAFDRWACVEGSKLRTLEVPVEFNDQGDPTRFNVFWDETGTEMMGPMVLGIGGGDGGPGAARRSGFIAFNGVHPTWTTTEAAGDPSLTDVESIAVHEAGHMLGLGHSCTDDTETDCLPANETVMNPTYPGGEARAIQQDDIDGMLAMYEKDDANDNSTCTGPFRHGQPCECDTDCIDGLNCVRQFDDNKICSPEGCSSDDIDGCGPGFNCVLATKPDDDTPAPGVCIQGVGGQAAPPGTACEGSEAICGDYDCTRSGTADADICFQSCTDDEGCGDGYRCSGIVCLLDETRLSTPCETGGDGDGDGDADGDDPGGCGCSVEENARPDAGTAAFVGLALLWRRRRARQRRA